MVLQKRAHSALSDRCGCVLENSTVAMTSTGFPTVSGAPGPKCQLSYVHETNYNRASETQQALLLQIALVFPDRLGTGSDHRVLHHSMDCRKHLLQAESKIRQRHAEACTNI